MKVEDSVERRALHKAKEMELKLRLELQENLVDHVQKVEDAISQRYQKAMRNKTTAAKRKFAVMKRNCRNAADKKVPSARLTLHSTKLCTKFKIFRIFILLLWLPLRHF